MPEPTISNIQLNLNSYKVYDADTAADAWRTTQANLYTVVGVTEDDGVTLRRLSIAELVMVVCLARAAEKEEAVIALMREMSDTTAVLNALTEIEEKLLDGQTLNNITGSWTYQGVTYTTAGNFLAAVGILPVNENRKRNLESLSTLANDLQTRSFLNCGGYYWNGVWRNGYGVLDQSGCLDGTYDGVSVYDAYYRAAELNIQGDVALSDAEVDALATNFGVSVPYGTLATEASRAVEEKFYNGFVKDKIQVKIDNYSIVDGSIPATDQLITDIESKMDSMNSFSQQKMIELQSETNKRDQAYDMITNILKSLNTVQTGISNNI